MKILNLFGSIKAAPAYDSADAKEKMRQTLEDIPRRTSAIIEKMTKIWEFQKKLKICEIGLSVSSKTPCSIEKNNNIVL